MLGAVQVPRAACRRAAAGEREHGPGREDGELMSQRDTVKASAIRRH